MDPYLSLWLNLKACSKQINHKMSKHFSILSKLWCNSNKQSKCVTDAIPLLLEYGKISKLYNIQMRNEGLCTKTGALNHISYCLTRGFKYLLAQELRWIYQNQSVHYLTVFCIDCTANICYEKLLKFKAEGWELTKFLRSLKQFIQTVKGQNSFL